MGTIRVLIVTVHGAAGLMYTQFGWKEPHQKKSKQCVNMPDISVNDQQWPSNLMDRTPISPRHLNNKAIIYGNCVL